jgi:hypothetical protein
MQPQAKTMTNRSLGKNQWKRIVRWVRFGNVDGLLIWRGISERWAPHETTTKDLHLWGQEGTGTHPSKKTTIEGWFFKFCL